jgi:hypothetical protein
MEIPVIINEKVKPEELEFIWRVLFRSLAAVNAGN